MAVQRIVLRRPGHPLAAADGRIHRNRLVLYEKIGPGPHKCHWCLREVRWYSKIKAADIPDDYLCSDHLDRHPRHDIPENLVPSCWACNLRRQQDRNPILQEIAAMPNKRGSRKNAYRRVSIPGHLLADSQGCVPEHQLSLWGKIGPGPHKCTWCGRPISWFASVSTLEPYRRLVPDHLNGFKADNLPENLVESCTPCNVMRGREDRVRDEEVFILDGAVKHRAEKRVCQWCKEEYLIRKAFLKADPERNGKFCSSSCRQSATLARQHGHTEDTLFGHNNSGKKFKAEKRICQECGKEFLFAVSMTGFCPGKFCSKSCSSRYNTRAKITGHRWSEDALKLPDGRGGYRSAARKLCEMCGTEFISITKERQRFCGHSCAMKYRRGLTPGKWFPRKIRPCEPSS